MTVSLEEVFEVLRKTLRLRGSYEFNAHRVYPNLSLPLSPVYFNTRIRGQGGPLSMSEVARLVSNMREDEYFRSLEFDAVLGVPRAADSFAKAYADQCKAPLLRLDKDTGELSGEWKEGDTVLLLENAVSTGESVLRVLDILEENKLNCADVGTLIDWELGGREAIRATGRRFRRVLTVTDIVGHYWIFSMLEGGHRIYEEVVAFQKAFRERILLRTI